MFLQSVGLLLGGSVVRWMVTSSRRAYAPGCVIQIAVPGYLPLPPATADLYLRRRLIRRSGSVSVGSQGLGVHQVLFEPSKHLWQVWCLILNVISPLLLSCWVSPLLLDVGYPFVLGSNILVYCYQTLRKWSKAFFSSEAWEVLPLDPGSLDCEREIKILKPKWILPFK